MNIHFIVSQIQSLKPGHYMTVSGDILREAAPRSPLLGFGGPVLSPCELALEKIVGSAFEFRAWEDERGNYVFERLKTPLRDGLRTYVSPDRLQYYNGPFAGIYYPKTK